MHFVFPYFFLQTKIMMIKFCLERQKIIGRIAFRRKKLKCIFLNEASLLSLSERICLSLKNCQGLVSSSPVIGKFIKRLLGSRQLISFEGQMGHQARYLNRGVTILFTGTLAPLAKHLTSYWALNSFCIFHPALCNIEDLTHMNFLLIVSL